MTAAPAKKPYHLSLPPSPSALVLQSHEQKWQEARSTLDRLKVSHYATALDDFAGIVQRIILSEPERIREDGTRFDGWANALTGIGTSRDKLTATTFAAQCQLSFSILEALYHDNDMAARVCDAVPEQMFREGYELNAEEESDAEAADEIEEKLEELGLDDALESGFIYGRQYGGALAILNVVDGQDESKPVNEATIQTVAGLTVLDRYALFPVKWYEDPKNPRFGEPEVYRILVPAGSNPGGLAFANVGLEVHETRTLRFGGARTSIRRKRANFGWDDSILQRVYEVLMQFGVSWASATHLMTDASQAVLTINGLIEGLAGNNAEVLATRAELLDKMRSSARLIMLDAEAGETFERKATPFTGIPEMLDRQTQRFAAAAKTPASIIMGIKSAGLNVSGDPDVRNWYDGIASDQRRKVRPLIKRVVKLITLSKDGPTGGKEIKVDVCFKPLWQLTPLEEADRRLKVAQKDALEIDKGIVTAEEVAMSRYGARGYSPETQIDLDLRKELAAQDDQAAQLGAGKMQAEKDAAAAEAAATAGAVPGEKPANGKPAPSPADK